MRKAGSLAKWAAAWAAVVLFSALVMATGTATIPVNQNIKGWQTVAGLLSANGGIACDTDKFTVANTTGNIGAKGTLSMDLVNAASGSANPINWAGTLGIMNGSDDFALFRATMTNANHTSTGNTVEIFDIAAITGDADCTEIAVKIGAGWDYGISTASPILGTGTTYLELDGATSGGIKLLPIATGTALTTISNQNVAAATITLPSATCTLGGLGLANAWTGTNTHTGASTFGTATATAGLAFGGGDDSTAILTTATADKSFGLFYTQTTATAGTSRGLYWKHHLADTTPSGEAARFYTSVDTAGANDAHGAHISLGYGASGTCAGESAALRSTLMVPTGTLGGTNASAYTEIWADAAGSTASNIQLQRYVLGGDATGVGLIEAAGVLFSVEGVTSGAGSIYYDHVPTNLAAGLKVKVVTAAGVTTEYILPLYSTE